MMARTRGGDGGGTMLELIVAVAVMGVVVVAILGVVARSGLLPAVDGDRATAAAAARDYAEAIRSTVADGAYVRCATEDSYRDPPGFSVPSGYVKSIVPGSLEFWNGLGWQAACPPDTGLQRLTVRVSSDDDRASEQIEVVLRGP